MGDNRSQQLATMRRAAASVHIRMRVGRMLTALPLVLTAGLTVSTAALAMHKVFPEILPEGATRLIFLGAGGLVVVVAAVAAALPLAPRAGTVALDRFHVLSDRITNALSFEALPKSERTPLMEIAIDDACAHATGLKPSKAYRIPLPADLLVPAFIALMLVAVGLLEIRTEVAPPPAEVIAELVMSPDDIELFREAAKELEASSNSNEVKAAVERFNQLIEDMAERRLNRTDAFREMEAIERELLDGAEADDKALDEEFKETGLELKKSELSQKAGEALEKRDLDQAEKEMRELAKRLRDKEKPPSKAELDKLRQALEKAAARRKEALEAVNKKRAEAQEQLLKKKKERDEASPDKKEEQERLLKKKQRELERLEREAQRRENAGRQLDRLDRELAEAAANLMKELGLSAEDFEQAAEDINRMQQEQMSREDKERLRQRLEELREILRQQGQGGDKRMARMVKFGKRARGGQGQGQGEGQKGKGQGNQPGEGQPGDGEGMMPGNGSGQGETLVLGPGGKPIPMPGQGPGQGQGQGNQPGGNSPDGAGKGIGSGSGGDIKGDATAGGMSTQDVEAVGAEADQGPSNSEVILAAAERGFKGGAYEKVFTDYRTVAEENINSDKIPDGYRFYVQRYFQLIRPRE